MKKPRIAILSLYWKPHKGGPAIYVYNLVCELKKKACYDIFVITPYLDPTPNDSLIVIKGSGMGLIMTTLLGLWQTKPNIIHCHVNIYMLVGAILFRLFHPSVRIIFTFHTQPVKYLYFRNDQNKIFRRPNIFKKWVFNIVYNSCDYITSVSEVLLANLKEVYGLSIKRRHKIITPGANLHHSRKERHEVFRSDNKLKNSFPIICTIGVFYWDCKIAGIVILLEAFKEIMKKYPEAKLIVVGDGRFRNYLEKRTMELSIKQSVIFTGYMEDPFIALNICDIYCHLGLNEGVSLAVIEAMSCGKPIIAARSGGLPEVIIDGVTGVLVDPNPQDTHAAIERLLDDESLRKTLAMNAKNVAKVKYRWEYIATEYIDIYETTAQNI